MRVRFPPQALDSEGFEEVLFAGPAKLPALGATVTIVVTVAVTAAFGRSRMVIVRRLPPLNRLRALRRKTGISLSRTGWNGQDFRICYSSSR